MSQAKIDIPEQLLRKHFFNQIVTSDFQIRLIRPSTISRDGRKILQLKESKSSQEEEDLADDAFDVKEPSLQKQLEQMKIISASYILDASANKKDTYSQLLNIANGAILAEYILNLREPNSTFTLNSLKIYLDGPLAMSYLDLNEEKASSHTFMLIESLRAKGASLFIFKGHIDEIRDNLRSAMNQDGSGIRRPTHRRMQGASFRSYAQSILSDLEGTFRRKQITIVSPSKSVSYFSEEDMESLTSALGDYAYHARERDAQAVGGILRLRSGKINSRSYFHECQHIFLTENKRVASASFEFMINNLGYKENYVPPVVTDRYLAGLMFVLYGSKEASELSHQKLLANCASALEPNHALLSKVTTFLSDVTEARAGAFVEMMTSSRSSQHRAIYLLDESKVINNLEEAEQVFADFEVEMRHSMNSEFDIERQRITEEHRLKLEATENEKIMLELDRKKAEGEYQLTLLDQEEDKTRIQTELLSKIQDLSDVKVLQQSQQEQYAASQLNDIEDLVNETFLITDRKQNLITRVLTSLTFCAVVIVNYWSFDPGDHWLWKSACALSLFLVPVGLSKLSNIMANRNAPQRRRETFHSLLKNRTNLRRTASNYDIDFTTGEVVLLPESGEQIVTDNR
ncbi:hypothetical protein [Pseudomonas coronafaciens]|uniref:Uncharacterized protein n=1 Tax=Pseudomonas coronafaciens pv. coronafaciens TaxID=235275 RepID=A0AAE6UL13_9PSED|nr:hypothetical protein [Pseudomonas coronafaciens]QGT81329.1 hypothetical protein GMO17_09095 [Pseudomonas coronafaciens pv. coronafaciens]RMM77508.1 hypothetical protein ALQ71_00984 [Pseudomonas coronafaciens pv. striafaciens]